MRFTSPGAATLSLTDVEEQGVCPQGHPCHLYLTAMIGYNRACEGGEFQGLPLPRWDITEAQIADAEAQGASKAMVEWSRTFLADREPPIVEPATAVERLFGIPATSRTDRRVDGTMWALALRQGRWQRLHFARLSTTPYINPAPRPASFGELRYGIPMLVGRWRSDDRIIWSDAFWRRGGSR